MMFAMATAVNAAADVPDSHHGLITYRVVVFEEESSGAVSVVTRQSVLAEQGTTVPIRVGMQTGYPVACSDSEGKAIACGDEWASTKQLLIRLRSSRRDVLIETDFEIRGGVAKGRRDIEPVLLLSQGRWQAGPNVIAKESVELSVPGVAEPVRYRVEVSAQAL